MKKMMTTGKKLRLHAQTLQTLSTAQLAEAAGGLPKTAVITDVPPKCGSFDCSP
jgi:hypothetical protein